MSFSKMPISRRIVIGYAIFFTILIAISVFVIVQNISAVSRSQLLIDNSESNEYVNDALSSFQNARVSARTMMISDDYNSSTYNDAVSQLEDALVYLSQSLEIEERYESTGNINILNDVATKISQYRDNVTLLNEANMKKKENRINVPAVGLEAINSIEDLISSEEAAFIDAAASGQAETVAAYDRVNFIKNVAFEFYNARVLNTKLIYLNDMTVYESIIESLEKVKQLLNEYDAVSNLSTKTGIEIASANINSYIDALNLHSNLLQQTSDFRNLCDTLSVQVGEALSEADDTLTIDLNDTILQISSSAKTSLTTVIVLMISALIINISLAVTIVKSINVALRSAMEKLKMASQNVMTASSELTNAATSLSQSSSEQASSIEETSATMNETASMITQNTQNTHQAVGLSKAADASASESVTQAENLIEFMTELNDSSDKINKIISTINAIASQTTILALNASVEAVRAGDAGKSFSVVAEEVRNLAHQSTLAVESTTAIIRENIELSRRGMESSKAVGDSLVEIRSSAEKVAQLLNEISTASDEQARGATQINIAMSEIEKVTQSIAAVSEQSAAAASELYNQAGTLEDLTNEIQVLVGA